MMVLSNTIVLATMGALAFHRGEDRLSWFDGRLEAETSSNRDKLFSGDSGNLVEVQELLAITICERAMKLKVPLIPAPRESFIMPRSARGDIGDLMKTHYKEHFGFNIEVDEIKPDTLKPSSTP